MSNTTLPSIQAQWVREFLGGPIPSESETVCQPCVLLSAAHGRDGTWNIHPRTKCCSYHPDLFNFQVGNVLNETERGMAQARAVMEERVNALFMATPLLLKKPPVYRLLYDRATYMGCSLRLCCPYYVEDSAGGRCGIWDHRNATCATWFCKHTRGQVGFTFWREAMEPLLKSLERALAFWCLTQLRLPEENLKRTMEAADCGIPAKFASSLLEETGDPAAHFALWGPWVGREAEFYCECGRRVSALSPWDVLAIGGPEAALYLRLARKAYRALCSTRLPRTVCPGRFEVHPLADGRVQVVGYSCYDPIAVPAVIIELLSYFEGRTVNEALRAMRRMTGIDMEPKLIRKLLDFGILVEAKRPGLFARRIGTRGRNPKIAQTRRVRLKAEALLHLPGMVPPEPRPAWNEEDQRTKAIPRADPRRVRRRRR